MNRKSGLWWFWQLRVVGPLRDTWWRTRTFFQRCRPCGLTGEETPRFCTKCPQCDL